MSNLFQEKILNKRAAFFITVSLMIGLLFDIYKGYEMPNADNFYAGAFFICIYVFIDIYMMHKILGMKLDSCLDRFFSPVTNSITSVFCFLPFFMSTSFYIWGDLSLFSVVVISITIGDLYYFYHHTQEESQLK
ncbi:hypothetical protein [Shewanella sp.]|uniref:hypothetical protein n=1 Tax=Shewanella sp. TaxID=50422 RepID=UPI004053EA2E